MLKHKSNNKVITTSFIGISKLTDKVKEIISQSNHLTHVLQNVDRTLPILEHLVLDGELLLPLENGVENIEVEINLLIAHLVEAKKEEWRQICSHLNS